MSYSIRWDNAEKSVVFQQYTEKPVKDDLYHLSEESAKMLQTVPHTVHIIIDERAAKVTLNSADIKFLENNVPVNQGIVVMLVNKSDLAYKKVMREVGQSLAPRAFNQPYFASTLEEARQILQAQYDVHYP